MAGERIERSNYTGTLGSDATHTINFQNHARIDAVYIHFSGNYNKKIMLHHISGESSNYDVELHEQKMKNGEDFIHVPDNPYIPRGDQFKIVIGEKSASVTYYMTIIWRPV